MKPTVVLTRAAEDSQRLAARLAAHGFSTCQKPLLEIQPLSAEALPAVPALGDRDVVIFVSVNAIHYGLPILREAGQSEAPLSMAVGRRTAAALYSAGLSATAPEREDSEGLLALPQLQVMTGRRVVIVKGQGGRELIADTLRERGAEVMELSCYRRHYLPLTAAAVATDIAPRVPVVWVASSAGMVEHLGAQLAQSGSPELKAQPLVVPSARVGLQAAQWGWSHVLTAADASDDAVMALLDRHYS